MIPFLERHLGPGADSIREMLGSLKLASLEELAEKVVPSSIRMTSDGWGTALGEALSEQEALAVLRAILGKNRMARSFIGQGFADCVVPPVIQRNVLENPGWYTQYTPYQAEISQGRLEGLLNFQTMICDLAALPASNASLLDEATACAEAMAMSLPADARRRYFVSADCHPQNIAVTRTRAEPLGIEIVVGDPDRVSLDSSYFGALLQNPGTEGRVSDWTHWIASTREKGIAVTVACDLLSLALVKPPGEMGADIAVGSAQRFGVPLGYGGPHAAFLACRADRVRRMPGRIVGVSRDATGKPAFRLALQTREQHIRREKATSNICTAQALLANMAAMYAVYHGPRGIRAIAERVRANADRLAAALSKLGHSVAAGARFDTVALEAKGADFAGLADAKGICLRRLAPSRFGITLDEKTDETDLADLLWVFAGGKNPGFSAGDSKPAPLPERRTPYLTHPVFNRYHSETEMLRYLRRLESRDLSLAHSMIPLGSCTMKLNATAEMFPVSWPEASGLHPYAPPEHARGYQELFSQLEGGLAAVTGMDAVSLQPNSGAQGEYAGLLAIRAYHRSRGDESRDVCLIPRSAHGTNPASAALAGMKIVVVDCDERGNVSVENLRAKAREHSARLAALMITYPSTHGVFEAAIREICEITHAGGGQVYMDGANLNAQVGLCRPGDFGADVCHINLHKTFCIPHGGGGPGMGPICAKAHLAPFFPGDPSTGNGAVSGAPHGSASILPISWMYIRMMGAAGLKRATQVAILNANYVAGRLDPHFPVLYRGESGFVAHECIVDLRPLKARSGVEVEDVAKRLMDYGYHAPTVSFPVPGTLMIEPTESESKEELDRFCEAMIAIRGEIREIEEGKADSSANLLKGAPHSAELVCSDRWDRPYSRERAAFPLPWVRERKFWPFVARIDNVAGDRNLVCTCPPVGDY